MIIDITQFKKAKPDPPMWFSPVCTPQSWKICSKKRKLTNYVGKKDYCRMESEGRDALAAAMVEPIRRNLEWQGIGRKLLMVDELPQGALARYKRDVAAVASILHKGHAHSLGE